MDRQKINLLIVNDDDLNCNCKDKTLNDITINQVGFSMIVLDGFELIIYSGSKGDKILKSKYTKTGKIE